MGNSGGGRGQGLSELRRGPSSRRAAVALAALALGALVGLAPLPGIAPAAHAEGKRGLVSRVVRALTVRPKNVDARTAAALIQPGDRVIVPVGQVTPLALLSALAERAATPGSGFSAERPVKLVCMTNYAPSALFDAEGRIQPYSLFIGPNSRASLAQGLGDFIPVMFSRIPGMIREGTIPSDVAVLEVSPPDRLGFVTLGPTAGFTQAALEKSRLVIAQVNRHLPVTHGKTRVHVSQLDYLVRADEEMPAPHAAEMTDLDRQIAGHIFSLVLSKQPAPAKTALGRLVERAKRKLGLGPMPSFQFGIGAIPDAVAQMAAEAAGLEACRIRTELIGPGTQKLVESGKVRGKVRYTFGMGDAAFLRWVHQNKKLDARPVDELNDPARISRIDHVVAINSALKVDLLGQISAHRVDGTWYSGVGGQLDFMRGALHSKGGMGIIALRSTAMVRDGQGGRKRESKIVVSLNEGDAVTSTMHDVKYVVTEHGVAALDGKSAVERARALIAVAHPDFRAELTASLEAQLARSREKAATRAAH